MNSELTIDARQITVADVPLNEWDICPTGTTLELVRQRHLTKDAVFKLQTGSGEYALKLYSPYRVRQDILYEHRVTGAFPKVVNAVTPVMSRYSSTASEGKDHRTWALFPWIDGAKPDSSNMSVLCHAARVLTEIHNQSEIVPDRAAFPTSVSEELQFACPARGLQQALSIVAGLVLPHQYAVIKKEMASQIEVTGPRCQIHGDFSPDNTLASGLTWTVLDWERTRPGEAYYDLAWAAYRWGHSAWCRAYFIYTYGIIRNCELSALSSATCVAVKFRFLRSLFHNADHLGCDPLDTIAVTSIREYASRIEQIVQQKDGWIPKIDSELQRQILLNLAGVSTL